MDCWENYEDSLRQVDLPWREGEPLTIPAKKTKIYAYLEVLLGTSKSQKERIKGHSCISPWQYNHVIQRS